MVSIQAQIIKSIFRSSRDKTTYSKEAIQAARGEFEKTLSRLLPSGSGKVTSCEIAGVEVDIVKASSISSRTIVYLHGGGFVMGSSKSYRRHLKRVSKLCSANVYSIEYSLSPEAPYPRALNDIQRVWEALITNEALKPERTVFMGDSAGGNLALASLLRYRDKKVTLPAALVMLSPFLDMTLSGESYRKKAIADPLLNKQKVTFFAESYTGKAEKENPYVSPVFANLKGLPPILIHVGDDEILLSDSRRVAQNAKRDGAGITLYVGKGMWHGWHLFASYVPEAKRAMKDVARFIASFS